MNSLSARPPMGQASSRFFKFCAQILQPSARRHQSSSRRTRSRLNIKPDPAFLPSKIEAHDHIIYTPPPSMPNVYHTPKAFLPKDDRRRLLQDGSVTTESQLANIVSTTVATADQLPPILRGGKPKKIHTTEQMEEMRALRLQDPYKWTISKLAKHFDGPKIFATIICRGLARKKAREQKMVTEVIKSRWGIKRRVAREDRAIRKEKWFRDG